MRVFQIRAKHDAKLEYRTLRNCAFPSKQITQVEHKINLVQFGEKTIPESEEHLH